MLIGFVLTTFGSFWIGGVCSYSTTAGPMNWDSSFIFSIIGLFIFITGLAILRFKIKRNQKILRLYYIIMSILLFSFGTYVITESKKRVNERCSESEGVDPIAPNGISLSILYFSCIGLFFYGIIGHEEKKNFKYLDNPKYD